MDNKERFKSLIETLYTWDIINLDVKEVLLADLELE